MIKKLRNQPHAPKVGAKRKEKKITVTITHKIKSSTSAC
jgi:hypothetical protein